MRKRLIIVGAGGMAREVLNWVVDVQQEGTDWEISGFLDKNSSALDNYDIDLPIVGCPDTYVPSKHEVFVFGIGDPKTRLLIGKQMSERGAQFIELIHPTACIGKRVERGVGFIACPFVCVTSDVKIGNFVFLNVGSVIGHDSVIGDGCTLAGHAIAAGYTELGVGVFLGSHANVHPGIQVGDFATIGAGSAAIRNVKQNDTVVGVPAKKIPNLKTNS